MQTTGDKQNMLQAPKDNVKEEEGRSRERKGCSVWPQARECGSLQTLEKARSAFCLRTSADACFQPSDTDVDFGPPELGENKPPLC